MIYIIIFSLNKHVFDRKALGQASVSRGRYVYIYREAHRWEFWTVNHNVNWEIHIQ